MITLSKQIQLTGQDLIEQALRHLFNTTRDIDKMDVVMDNLILNIRWSLDRDALKQHLRKSHEVKIHRYTVSSDKRVAFDLFIKSHNEDTEKETIEATILFEESALLLLISSYIAR